MNTNENVERIKTYNDASFYFGDGSDDDDTKKEEDDEASADGDNNNYDRNEDEDTEKCIAGGSCTFDDG
jgi:hypothetical protein